jgi:hypothetical protein
MSSPSFLFANEGNHLLLQSLLEALNAIVEHQYSSKHAAANPFGDPRLITTLQRTLI